MNKSIPIEYFNTLSQDDLNDEYILACKNKEIDKVKYLLTSPELRFHANINSSNGEALRIACIQGNLPIVEYLLTSPDLKKHAYYTTNNYDSLASACFYGKVDIVDFFFTHPKLKEQIDIHCDQDKFFRMAMYEEQLSILQYFIFDMDIEKTVNIAGMINNASSEFADKVNNMFAIRELNKNLEKELKSDRISIPGCKKAKI